MPFARSHSLLLLALLTGCGFPSYKFIVGGGDDAGDHVTPTPDGRTEELDTSLAEVDLDASESGADAPDVLDGAPDALCTDTEKNGLESDVDCGGETSCSRCGIGQRCSGQNDCASHSCVGGKCSQATCDDSSKNGSETDVDCGGSCPLRCADGKQCLNGGDCTSRSCIKGVCEAPSCTDQVKNGSETDADCGGTQCPKCSVGKWCVSDGDCTDAICRDGTVAGTRVCVSAKCINNTKDPAESDVDCGGRDCDKCSDGKACLATSDCVSGVCGTNGRCSVPACDDQVKNGNETDLDCGGRCASGAKPVRCVDTLGCVDPNDCQSNVCSGGKCQRPTCIDLMKNGDETDTDCGGSCPACPDTATCLVLRDCRSGVCDPTLKTCSVPTCIDTVKNGLETDTDCGGDLCRAESKCDDGKGCGKNEDCKNGRCSNRVCVAAQCNDTVKNGSETDIDCGGPSCGDCPDGKACLAGTDCTSGVCSSTALTCQAPTCPDGIQNAGETDVDCGGPSCATKCEGGKVCNTSADCALGYTCPPGAASPSKVCTNEFQIIYHPLVTAASSNIIKFSISIRNNGTRSVPMSKFKVVYWFSREIASISNLYTGRCDSSTINNGYCTVTFSDYTPATALADTVMTLNFSTGIDSSPQYGTLAPGATWPVLPISFDRGGTPTMSQTNDYSFSPTDPTSPWPRVGLLLEGKLVWGDLPQ